MPGLSLGLQPDSHPADPLLTSLHSCSLVRLEENVGETAVKLVDRCTEGRLLTYCCCGQNRLDLGKINLIIVNLNK